MDEGEGPRASALERGVVGSGDAEPLSPTVLSTCCWVQCTVEGSPLPPTGCSSLAPLRLLVIEKWPATRSGQEHTGLGHTSPALLSHGCSWECQDTAGGPHGCRVLWGL